MEASVTIPISGMTCNHCVAAVRDSLQDVPGVHSAQVTLEPQQAVVSYDDSVTQPADMHAAIRDEGYEVSA